MRVGKRMTIGKFRVNLFCKSITIALLLLRLPFAQAQDTLRLSIDSVEQRFLKNNLALIAQKYEIASARAAIIQAHLFENPTFYYENYIPNPFKGQYYSPNTFTENYFQLQQLFHIAGQRKKRTNIEKINTQMNEYEYYDMIRSLRNELHNSFYDAHYLLQALNMYQRQLVSAKKIADAMDEQYKKGNLSLKEVTRIKALVFSLESGKLDVTNQLLEKENSLKILTRSSAQTFIVPVSDDSKVESFSLTGLSLQKLISTADTGRFDLKEASAAIDKEQASYIFQKSLAIPDLTLGLTYDRSGNFINNYSGLGVQLPLPLWNRNQGNILVEKNLVEERKVQFESMKNQVDNEVTSAYAKALEAETLYKNFDKSFASDYDKLIGGITKEYEKHNVSLLEFLDYYETYTQSMSDVIHLRSLRIEAIEAINLATGTIVIK